MEHVIQRRLFFALAGFIFVLATVYAVVGAVKGQYTSSYGAIPGFCAAALSLTTMVFALRSNAYVWPLRVLSIFIVAWLTFLSLRQGAGLPAAAWWLSVIPFILGGAGLHYLAIAVVLDFLAIVVLLYFGGSPAFGIEADPVSEKWRRFVAVVGSEMLALGLIIVAMRSRAQVARALEHARQVAQSAGDLKARFLANMSHEIRTPLMGIIGVSEVLKSPALSDAQRTQLVGLQEQSARTLLALVNDVLDFAKLDAGKVSIELQPLHLREVVIEANELFSVQAFAKGIELSSSCNPDVPRSFVGDPVRIRQILSNLVSNAVKFTSRGGVHIHLAIDPLDDKRPIDKARKRWVRIEVVDSGLGISDMQLQGLFRPFVQADPSVTRRFGGTGLGLSISNELARLMDGRIEVRSVVGQGSSFSLVVPLRVDLEWEPAPHASRRADVVVCTANKGLERHLKSLFQELRVDPAYVGRLPSAVDLMPCRLLFVDAPLLHALNAKEYLSGQAGEGRQVVILTPLGADAVLGLPDDALLVYKPVRKRALENLLLPRVEQGSAASGPRAFASLHVLVVEDNAVNQIVVQAMLAELGASSAVAGTGHEALDYLASEAFDLVLMDIHMPEMDGLATTRALRAREAELALGHVTVLAMTASTESEDRMRCLAAGMDGYLTKPFGLSALRQILESVMVKPSADH